MAGWETATPVLDEVKRSAACLGYIVPVASSEKVRSQAADLYEARAASSVLPRTNLTHPDRADRGRKTYPILEAFDDDQHEVAAAPKDERAVMHVVQAPLDAGPYDEDHGRREIPGIEVEGSVRVRGYVLLGDWPSQRRVVEVLGRIALVRKLLLDPSGDPPQAYDDSPVDDERGGNPAELRRGAQLVPVGSHTVSAYSDQTRADVGERVEAAKARSGASGGSRPKRSPSFNVQRGGGREYERLTEGEAMGAGPARDAEHYESVAAAALAAYAALPPRGKPKRRDNRVPEWTVLAAVCLLRQSVQRAAEVRCVSLG